VATELVLGVLLVRTRPPNRSTPWHTDGAFTDAPPCSVINERPVRALLGTSGSPTVVQSRYREDDDPNQRCTYPAGPAGTRVEITMWCRLGMGGRPEIVTHVADRALGTVFPNGASLDEHWPGPGEKSTTGTVHVGFTIDNLSVAVSYSLSYPESRRSGVPATVRDRSRANTLDLARTIAANLR
jgi:hypothetical protein